MIVLLSLEKRKFETYHLNTTKFISQATGQILGLFVNI